MSDLGRGYTHVYTGDGKGKTTASLGLTLRAAGNGLSVLIIQFLKGQEMTGERKAVEQFAPDVEIRPRGRDGVLRPDEFTQEDKVLAMEALVEGCRESTSQAWDVIVLDEINTACSLGLIPVARVLEIIDAKPEGLELVLTGRGAPKQIIEKADLVTEMKEIKHYFRQGVKARRGIEK
jgi:cob(I)alamin adenosyltransferase